MRLLTSTLLTLVAALLPASISAQSYGPDIPEASKEKPAAKTAECQPKMELAETEFDWGTVLQGDKVVHKYEVKNSGQATLRITQVKPGCGCTTKNFDREIAPGEMGQIELTVDTTKFKNKIRKYATIFTNDPENARTKIFIGGNVNPLVVSDPAVVRLQGLAGDELTGQVSLAPGTDLQIEIEKASSVRNQFEVVKLNEIGEGKYEIGLKAVSVSKPSILSDTLVLSVRTSDGKLRDTNIPVRLEHRDRVVIQPRGNVIFHRRDTERLKTNSTKPVVKSMQIYGGREDIRFKVLAVELKDVPEGVFDVSLDTIKENERYRVKVELKQFLDNVRTVRGKVVITTDDPESPVKEMGLFAQFNTKLTRQRPRRPGRSKLPEGKKPSGK